MTAWTIDLRAAAAQVSLAALRLNGAAEVETSPLDARRLESMLSTAAWARACVGAEGDVFAILIAFARDADYDNLNFQWFNKRMERFFYVDRVIVAQQARGRGVARALYLELFDHARALGLRKVVCEVNLAPPNPGSDAFHAALGFVEVGRATRGAKTVRYLACDVD